MSTTALVQTKNNHNFASIVVSIGVAIIGFTFFTHAKPFTSANLFGNLVFCLSLFYSVGVLLSLPYYVVLKFKENISLFLLLAVPVHIMILFALSFVQKDFLTHYIPTFPVIWFYASSGLCFVLLFTAIYIHFRK